MGGALWRFWWYRGHLGEGRGILERLLQHSSAADLRAKALDGVSGLAWIQGDLSAAQRLAGQSLALYRALGDKAGIANALQGLAVSYDDAGDLVRARPMLEEELALRRELGDRRGLGIALGNLGELARISDDLAAARTFYQEGLASLRVVGDRSGIATCEASLGLIDLVEDADSQGTARLVGALRIWEELGDLDGVALTIDGLAMLAEKLGQAITATRLLGASENIRETVGSSFQASHRGWYDELVAAVRATLGDETFDAAWNAGKFVSVEEAIVEAVALADSVTSSTTRS